MWQLLLGIGRDEVVVLSSRCLLPPILHIIFCFVTYCELETEWLMDWMVNEGLERGSLG